MKKNRVDKNDSPFQMMGKNSVLQEAGVTRLDGAYRPDAQARRTGVFEYEHPSRNNFPLMNGQSGELSSSSAVNTSKQQLIVGKASSHGIDRSYQTNNLDNSQISGLPL
jgi:hypothetical protein